MATGFLSPIGGAAWQFFTDEGVILAGGQLFTYLAGTTTPAATYTSSTLSVPNPNPIILNSSGRTPNEIWLQQGTQYKFVVEDVNGNLVTPGTWDNISGINDVSVSSNTSVWATSNLTPTYISATSFSVPGNQTSVFTVSRRIQATVAAGTVYGQVTASSFGSGITTVTVTLDSGALDSGLSAIYYGIDDPTHTSVNALINVQTFTSSGTYTPTNGTTKIIVEAVGGGGAGGGTSVTGSGNCAAGGGGGGSPYGKIYIPYGVSAQTVTIGAAGNGTLGGSGGNGGTTSFGSILVVTGGVGGANGGQGSGSIGGFASGGGGSGGSTPTVSGSNVQTIALLPGGNGGVGMGFTTAFVVNGTGGSSVFGNGGAAYGNAASGRGAGGLGNGVGQNSAASAGFGGTGGLLIIYEYL
jgi:hypothetical protein